MPELQSDHNEVFDVLIARLMPGVKGIVHKLGNRSRIMDGDDLTQMALIHLWMLFCQGSAQDKTISYLLQGCYHHLRNQLRLRQHASRETSLENLPDHSLEDSSHNKTLLRSVYESGLTERETSVLSQLLDGLTVREIGAHMGVSHVQVVKIKKSIRSKLPNTSVLYL